MRVVAYGTERCIEAVGVDAIERLRREQPVVWVDVAGFADLEAIRAIGDVFGLHDLALEDLTSVHQRPKADVYDDHVFVVTRLAELTPHLVSEQIGVFVGDGFVLSFRAHDKPCFDRVLSRIRDGRGRVRGAPADYLAYCLLDAVVDHYFPLLDQCGDRLEAIESDLVRNVKVDVATALFDVQHDLHGLRRILHGLREQLEVLRAEASALLHDETRLYLRDCEDHVLRLDEDVGRWLVLSTSLLELQTALRGHEVGEATKMLTIIATIFIPLGFIAAVYGMNFDRTSAYNMPELGWRYGYLFALGLMAAVTLGLVAYFRRRRWIGARPATHASVERPPA